MTQHKRFESKQFFRVSFIEVDFFLILLCLCCRPKKSIIKFIVFMVSLAWSKLPIWFVVFCAASYGGFFSVVFRQVFIGCLHYYLLCEIDLIKIYNRTRQLTSFTLLRALRIARTHHKWFLKKNLAENRNNIVHVDNFAFRSFHCRWPATLSLSRFRSFPCACGIDQFAYVEQIPSLFTVSNTCIAWICWWKVESDIGECALFDAIAVAVSAYSNCYRYRALFCGDGEPNRKCQ